MRILLTITALVEIAVGAAAALSGDYSRTVIWGIAAATTVGWALAETAAAAWKRRALAAEARRRADIHIHKASCRGPAGELQCAAEVRP